MKRLAVSIKRAGKVIGVRRSSIYALLRKGGLRAIKIGSRTLVTIESLESLVSGAEATGREGNPPVGTHGDSDVRRLRGVK